MPCPAGEKLVVKNPFATAVKSDTLSRYRTFGEQHDYYAVVFLEEYDNFEEITLTRDSTPWDLLGYLQRGFGTYVGPEWKHIFC